MKRSFNSPGQGHQRQGCKDRPEKRGTHTQTLPDELREERAQRTCLVANPRVWSVVGRELEIVALVSEAEEFSQIVPCSHLLSFAQG